MNSGAQTITSTVAPQFRIQYDSSNEITTSVNSTGTTTLGINGASPGLFFTPQTNLVNTFNFTDATSNSILSIDTLNQRVGISTTSPGSKLSIYGSAGTVTGISLGNWNDLITTSRYIGITKYGAENNLATDEGFSGIEFGGPSGTGEGYLAFHTHDLGTASSERVRIDKSGNVGIGTSSPYAKLSVAGSAGQASTSPLFAVASSTALLGGPYASISGRGSSYFAGRAIDPEFISETQGPTPGTSLDGPIGIFVSGKYAYVVNSNRDSLAVIDISNPASPTFIAETQGPTPGTSLDGARNIFVSGKYAYVANQNRDSLAVIDIKPRKSHLHRRNPRPHPRHLA